MLCLATTVGWSESPDVPAVTWTENLNGALARAGNELKPVLLVFSSPDCPWCVRLKKETLAEKEVLTALEGFICVAIDTSRDARAAQEFQVQGVPMTVILSGDGRPQAVSRGFMDKVAFLRFLDEYRKGGGRSDGTPVELSKWLKALESKTVTPAQWPELMAGLGNKESRIRLHQAMLAYDPLPRRDWVELLKHSQLSVRLGTFEILEELAGNAYGYDPWFDAEANRQALEQWQTWAAGSTNDSKQVFAPLTEEQILGYIRDLAAGDRERSARAVRMLEQAGESVIPVLESWASGGTGASAEALRRVKEVRYYLLLPESLGTERSRIVHRLVFGNQDERLRSLAAAALAGERAMPVLADFLADPDPLIREAAVDCLITAGKKNAFEYLTDLLKTEKDEEVIHAVIRGAGNLSGPKAVELVGPFLSHANEDLAVAALASLARTKSVKAAAAVKDCLKNPRWRVRAAALEALGKLMDSSAESEVSACLEDSDPFVRRTAVLTLSALSADSSIPRLEQVFLKDDQLKGPVVGAIRQMNKSIPSSFGPALKGKDPDVLLAVLEGLGNGGSESWRLAFPYVHHENTDVACAAIRVVARGGGKQAEVQAELAKVLHRGVKERVRTVFEAYRSDADPYNYARMNESFDSEEFDQLVAPVSAAAGSNTTGSVGDALTDLFAAFTVAPVAVVPVTNEVKPVVEEAVNLQDVFSAFGPAVPVAPPVASVQDGVKAPAESGDIGREALVYVDSKQDGELRFGAALMLMAMGNQTGVTVLVESLASRTVEERLAIATRAALCKGDAVLPLVQRLLKDPSADVRQAAVALCLKDSAGDALVNTLIEAALEPGTVLNPADLFKNSYQWNQVVRRPAMRRKVGTAVRGVLDCPDAKRYGAPWRILALSLLESCWKEGDQASVSRYLDHENPFVRRAAWYVLGKQQPAAFLEKIQQVERDTSEWVRAVVPAVYSPAHVVQWTVYFDAETAAGGMSSYSSSSNARKKLPRPVVEILQKLCSDSALPVRSSAALCLFANREKVELRLLVATLEATSEKQMMAYRLSSIFQEMPLSALRELNVNEVLVVLDKLMAQMGENTSQVASIREKLIAGSGRSTNVVKAVLRKTPVKEAGTSGADESVGAAAKGGKVQRLVVFFRNPGCRDCARVAELLSVLSGEFTDLVVEEMDIRNPKHVRINEALCDHFEVAENYRLVAPAIFCGAGTLSKGDITFERLGAMLSRSAATDVDWRTVSEAGLAQAGLSVAQRYSAMGIWLIFGACLLDGINPCAFATIIFLLSYLQVTRRGPREILAVGGAFVAGIFLAYFLLGLGLVELVVRLSVLRGLGLVLNWAMAAFVAGVALLSVWDGVQCLRGRMGDMVLQLPGVLKARIHDAVRRSTRHRHFVVASFVAGLVIAVLELACTGQVYAPTILYMLKTGQDRLGAIAYLALYNLAFIVPLLVVFTGAYGGLRSERLTVWLQQRAALVKFATALLFSALFVLFVLGNLRR